MLWGRLLYFLKALYLSVSAAITGYHSLGGLNTDIYFSQFWRQGSLRSGCQAGWVCRRPSSWSEDGFPLAVCSPGRVQREKWALVSLTAEVWISSGGLYHHDLITSQSVCSVAELCPTLCDPRSAACQAVCPWDFPGKNTGVDCYFFLLPPKVPLPKFYHSGLRVSTFELNPEQSPTSNSWSPALGHAF